MKSRFQIKILAYHFKSPLMPKAYTNKNWLNIISLIFWYSNTTKAYRGDKCSHVAQEMGQKIKRLESGWRKYNN